MNFIDPRRLDYAANAAHRDPAGLMLDAAYRTFHLPIVNASHPDIIRNDAETNMGRFTSARRSLVAFVDQANFDQSDVLKATLNALRQSRASKKLDWSILDRRRHLLHFTISPIAATVAPDQIAEGLADVRPFHVRALGPWLGRARNNGRMYLPVCPENVISGQNVIHDIQRRLGIAPTNFYGIGFHNLTDHLNSDELDDVLAVAAGYADAAAFDVRIGKLSLIETFDSLTLDSKVIASYELR